MSWNRKVVVRILILIATMIEDEPGVREQAAALGRHIEVWAPKEAA